MNAQVLKASAGLAALAVVMAACLFVPARTLSYWQAWLYLGVFFGASTLITIYLLVNDPALLQRRLRSGPLAEKETPQRIIMLLASFAFIALLVVPALDHRFRWSSVPQPIVLLGDALVAVSFYWIFRVYKENSFTSATIEISHEQKVVSTGPYAFVRHPMYAGAVVLFIGSPIALGSYWGFLPLVALLPALIWRLVNEERFLLKQLPGYPEYCARVRWRLLPHVF